MECGRSLVLELSHSFLRFSQRQVWKLYSRHTSAWYVITPPDYHTCGRANTYCTLDLPIPYCIHVSRRIWVILIGAGPAAAPSVASWRVAPLHTYHALWSIRCIQVMHHRSEHQFQCMHPCHAAPPSFVLPQSLCSCLWRSDQSRSWSCAPPCSVSSVFISWRCTTSRNSK